jgi:hypothetical protein
VLGAPSDRPRTFVVRNVRRIVDGARAVNLYDFAIGPISLPTAEAFELVGDRIARIDLYFDPSPLLASRGG